MTASRPSSSQKTESSHPQNSISGHSDRNRPSLSENDEFNAKDYYQAEDFYEDHYDDFYDFEDAEDYYNEH